jgi:glutathione S-transferase
MAMRNLATPDMLLVALISLVSLVLCIAFAIAVSRARVTYKIAAPAMSGNAAFERVVRVHANTVDNLAPFLVALWLCALLFSPVAAIVLGSIWLIARLWYALAYYRDADKRVPAFGLSIAVTVLLIIGALIGVVRDVMLVG